ncbi:MAG TPA: VWA domain-containing protein [Bryobacteraceae bacterium]|jgi:VWFA-related protein|nr:VWA domain-containing protein [Bryobacteraceae bacterium]
MRSVCISVLLLFLLHAEARPQGSDPGQTTLRVRSTLVEVPALVKTKKGQVVFDLTAADFSLTDNGVPQKFNLESDTDSQPLALAICVETGGGGIRHFDDYQHLGAILDALIGNVDRRVAVIGFDGAPRVLVPFTKDTAKASDELSVLQPGNSDAAILDAVAFAVEQLRDQPPNYRRAILLFSETIDHGSSTPLGNVLRLIGDTNTALYSFAFSSTRAAVSKEAAGFGYGGGREPGPPGGCFSREGADAEYEGHYSRQVLDCLSQLAPPLRLATMAFLTARNSLRTNTAASLTELTGGEFIRFNNGKELRNRLISMSRDVLNHYVLTFRPDSPASGPHTLHLELKNHPELVLTSRTEYWNDDPAQ